MQAPVQQTEITDRISCSFCDLPEISGDALADEMHEVGLTNDDEPFWKQYRCIFGW